MPRWALLSQGPDSIKYDWERKINITSCSCSVAHIPIFFFCLQNESAEDKIRSQVL